ncbi:sensor [Oxalicibacterium flavum]|uniref:Sensor n=1 Tax=Oxalicibacterium flavum TaxID=179467 RepID=A0A8J2UP94_9BURK|nr:FecR domain-containing protein [Oxalicibacterium flavum]GGB98965.1 sensor [Oxalicibacterium flavum]
MDDERKGEDIAEQAAAWIMRLTCDDETERARAQAGFAAWKAADARHAVAAARIESFVGSVQDMRQDAGDNLRPVHAALNAAHEGTRRQRRRTSARRIGGVLLLACALAVPAWLALQGGQPVHLLADLRSSEGQWITHTLTDGSRITLSGVSAVNLRYDEHNRTIDLLHGEILVDVAKDAARPFLVRTPLATIRALGTRFAVTHQDDASVLDMFESRVSVHTHAAHSKPEDLVVEAGQRVRLGQRGVDRIEAIDATRTEEGWRSHRLVIRDRPLPEVLEQLMRHRRGRIHYDAAELAHIRVSGVLPLDDTDQALQLLQTNFPELRMRFLTARWVWVGLQAGG